MTDEHVLEVRISLAAITPSVWRRVLVPTTYTLRQLHFVVQHVMPWADRHLYEFEISGARYGAPDPFDDDADLLDDAAVLLETVLPAGTSARYTYDFGDCWQHDITVEKRLPAPAGAFHPVCLNGAGATPPDDVGGVGGYADFVEAMADASHPEHAEWRAWIGRDCGSARLLSRGREQTAGYGPLRLVHPTEVLWPHATGGSVRQATPGQTRPLG